MARFNLSKITAQLVGLGYELGRMDCFAMIVAYLAIRGREIPESFGGQTMDTYKNFYEADPVAANELMVDFIDSLLEQIPPHRAFAGDVLLLELDGHPPFLALDGGNGVVIMAIRDKGVMPTNKSPYTIRRAWRCPV